MIMDYLNLMTRKIICTENCDRTIGEGVLPPRRAGLPVIVAERFVNVIYKTIRGLVCVS